MKNPTSSTTGSGEPLRRKRNRHPWNIRLLFAATTFALLVCGEAARAQVGKDSALHDLTGKNITATLGGGLQEGLTTVELQTNGWTDYAGYALRLRLLKDAGNARLETVEDRKVGVMTDGKFSASLAAYN